MSPSATSPACSVCGDVRPEIAPVHCVTCDSAHHPECWLYNRRCATYGCDSRTAAVPSTGLHREWFGATPIHYLQIAAQLEPAVGACPVCHLGWKAEYGARCSDCDQLYHEACWSGLGGCTQHECREASRRDPSTSGPILIVGAGLGNCRVCDGLDPRPTSVKCPTCERHYHQGCWTANRGCLLYDCRFPEDKKAKASASASPR